MFRKPVVAKAIGLVHIALPVGEPGAKDLLIVASFKVMPMVSSGMISNPMDILQQLFHEDRLCQRHAPLAIFFHPEGLTLRRPERFRRSAHCELALLPDLEVLVRWRRISICWPPKPVLRDGFERSGLHSAAKANPALHLEELEFPPSPSLFKGCRLPGRLSPCRSRPHHLQVLLISTLSTLHESTTNRKHSLHHPSPAVSGSSS